MLTTNESTAQSTHNEPNLAIEDFAKGRLKGGSNTNGELQNLNI